jgi:hypothetical protein
MWVCTCMDDERSSQMNVISMPQTHLRERQQQQQQEAAQAAASDYQRDSTRWAFVSEAHNPTNGSGYVLTFYWLMLRRSVSPAYVLCPQHHMHPHRVHTSSHATYTPTPPASHTSKPEEPTHTHTHTHTHATPLSNRPPHQYTHRQPMLNSVAGTLYSLHVTPAATMVCML